MEDGQNYPHLLEEALDAKRAELDRVDLVRLKENWKLFQAAFQGVNAILNKKGIIHEDPYQYELKISEVTNPPEGPFSESEKIDQMSLRISQFEAYLDFLNNYYQFDTEFLTMGRIKRLLGLVKYFNFTQLTETSNQLNTRCLAELLGTIRKGSDPLSGGLIAEGVGQLDKASREILAILKELTGYHRERYKLELRQIVLPGFNFEAGYVIAHRDEALRQIRHKFAEVAGERPFYPELVEELLQEDFSSDGPNLRNEALARLKVREEKKTEKAQEKSYKVVVLEGIRILAGVNYQLDEALGKLGEASALLQARNQGFWFRFRQMLKRLLAAGETGLHYTIEIVDPITSVRTPEEIEFNSFFEEGNRKARLLASLLQRSGPGWKRLETAPEDQAYKFLERNMEELQRLVKRISALDEFFKSEIGAEDRPRLRGVKSEITTIRGALVKANQKKHEYVAQKEEQEQMRRLGIRAE